MSNSLLYLLLGWIGGVIPLSQITRLARQACDRWDKLKECAETTESQPVGGRPPRPRTPTSTVLPIPKHERPDHWMKQLGRREGIFGGALGLPFLVILFLNSYLISVRIEQLVGWEANEILGTIRIGEWLREISLFDAVGLMISLCQAIAAAALLYKWIEKEPVLPSWVSVAAGIILAALIASEVGVSAYGGQEVNSLAGALFSAGLAFGVAGVAALVGAYVGHHFLEPLFLMLLWGVIAAFRALARWWQRQGGTRQQVQWHYPLRYWLLLPLAVIDQYLMDPLRRLDEWLNRVLHPKPRLTEPVP